jgi:hypothetical protein
LDYTGIPMIIKIFDIDASGAIEAKHHVRRHPDDIISGMGTERKFGGWSGAFHRRFGWHA